MNFNIDELNQKSLDEIRKIFSFIPKTEVQLEFSGRFDSDRAAKALFYIPKHVYSIVFKGFYIYCHTTKKVYKNSGSSHVPDSSEEVSYYVRTLSYNMSDYISNLPKTVSEVSLDFSPSLHEPYITETEVVRRLRCIVSQLPKSVTTLNFNRMMLTIGSEWSAVAGTDLNDFIKMLEGIPKSVLTLYIEQLNFNYLINRLNLGYKGSRPKDILLAIHRGLENISLAHTDLTRMEDAAFSEGLPPSLKSIDLGFNNLGTQSQKLLLLFLSHLPQQLITVLLAGNNLSRLGCDNLCALLPVLPITVRHVDLSENGLLFLSTDELTTILKSLRLTVTSLKLCESNTTVLSFDDLSARFAQCLPFHIDTISFSNCKLLGRSMTDFAVIVHSLPETIQVIDLSDNELSKKSKEDLILLLSHIPPHIQKIKLNRNGLCGMDISSLRDILASLPKNIEIELAENGFEGLPYSYVNQLMDALPDALIHFGKSRFSVRGNGALVPASCPALQSSGLFRAQTNIRHQSEFSFLQLTIMQLTQSKKIGADVLGILISFIFHCTPQDIIRMVKQIEATSTLIPAKEVPMTLASQKECKKSVEYRITTLIPGETVLDLSRCALNRLDTAGLKAIFKTTIPKGITSLILKGNGFQNSQKAKANFIAALDGIPKKIIYIDLSENGFENLEAVELKALFINFPKTVRLVSLSTEKPISPAEQIAKRLTPRYYQKLIKDAPSLMEQARILLNDYSKGGSAFKRFISVHWNRNHSEEVVKLEFLIDNGIITNLDDLLAEIEAINLKNPAGCLGKRSMFLIKNANTQVQRQEHIPQFETLTITDESDEKTFQA